jgi:2-enoate reductase
MTNPAFNRRSMGKYANWQQFGLEIVKEIRKRCGPDYPIWYRIDLSLALNATYGDRMKKNAILKKFKNERTVAQTLEYMVNLVKAGVDMFDIDLGCYENHWLPHPPTMLPPGLFLKVAHIAKQYFREHNIQSNAGLPVPIIAVGKLGYPDLAEQALRDEKCDMVILARPLLADPDWANKAYLGKCSEICPCIGDQEGCFHEFIEGGHPQCSLNPRTGYEDIYPAELSPTATPKSVLVIGAGPAGIECACTAAQRGHTVTLVDKNDRVGGMLLTGSVPKAKIDLVNYLNYLDQKVKRHQAKYGLKIQLKTGATLDYLKKEKFDAIIFCTGSESVKPPIPTDADATVLQATDFLQNPKKAEKAQTVTIIGGGIVGCEVAHMLATEQNKHVTVVEMLPDMMHHAFNANRGCLIHYLEKANVKLLNCAKVTKITKDRVFIEHNVSPTVPDPYNTWSPILPENVENPFAKPIKEKLANLEILSDLVILAVGMKPNNALYNEAMKANLPCKLYNIGDSFEVNKVLDAVKAGYLVGKSL